MNKLSALSLPTHNNHNHHYRRLPQLALKLYDERPCHLPQRGPGRQLFWGSADTTILTHLRHQQPTLITHTIPPHRITSVAPASSHFNAYTPLGYTTQCAQPQRPH
eukprot:6491407-Amphidinium_carterae.4